MADLASLLANAGQTNTDFNAIPGIEQSYWEGVDQGFKNRQRNAFSNGLPTNPDGSPNYGEAAKRLYQVGDMTDANQMTALDLARQKLTFGQQAGNVDFPTSAAPSQPPQNIPPSPSRSGATPVAPAINQGRPQPQPQPAVNPATGNGRSATIMQILTAQGIPNDQLGPASASIARQLGVDDPNSQLDLNDPQVRNVLTPAIAQLKRMGVGQVVDQQQQQPAGAQPTPPQAQPQPPQQPQSRPPQLPQVQPSSGDQTLGGLVPAGRTPQQQLDLLSRRLASGMLDPETAKAYQDRISAIQTAMQPTGEQKNYALYSAQERQAGHNPLPFSDWQADIESKKSTATEQAKADVKEQTDIISAGRTAQNRLATLNTISNIVSSDKNLTQGFGADTALKVKMALEQMGVPVGDLSGAQAIQKLNAVLASESTKAISPRPAQFEFRTFLANNPGLNLDKAGNQRVIGIYSQLAKREVDLGRLARQNRDNWDNWDQIVQDYDKKNPMRDPKTGQPITTDTIIAPGKGDDVFAKARAAISQGAPRDAVIKRLKDAGHDPAGL